MRSRLDPVPCAGRRWCCAGPAGDSSAGEDHGWVRHGRQVGQATPEDVERPRWQRDGAPAGVGLRLLLDEQAAKRVAGHRADDGERAGREVDVCRPDGTGLADAQAGAEHEVDEVGQLLHHRCRVGRGRRGGPHHHLGAALACWLAGSRSVHPSRINDGLHPPQGTTPTGPLMKPRQPWWSRKLRYGHGFRGRRP
jgi:hypothetical protein